MNVINRGWIKARTWALKAAWWLAGYHIAAPKGKIIHLWLIPEDTINVTVMTPFGIIRAPLTIDQARHLVGNLRLLIDIAKPREAWDRIQREIKPSKN